MSEPKRWLDQGAPKDVQHLVRAARAEQPDKASLGRTLAAVGIGLGATSVAAGAKAAGTAASVGGTAKVAVPITGSLLVKWTALGATVGILAAGAVEIATEVPRVAPAPPSAVPLSAGPRPGSAPGVALAVNGPVTAPPNVRGAPLAPTANGPHEATTTNPVAAPRPAAPASASGGPRPTAPDAAPASGGPLAADTLAEEVKSVDRARALLAAGQATQTLVVLDEYERHFRARGFAPEALYLRMEAYTSLGRTAEARAAAERLLASYPNSLHGARARTVLSKIP